MSRRILATCSSASSATVSSTSVCSIPCENTLSKQFAHVRAAHGGSGSNTELRAQIRRERELEKARASTATIVKDQDAQSRRPTVTLIPIANGHSLVEQKLCLGTSNDDENPENLVSKRLSLRPHSSSNLASTASATGSNASSNSSTTNVGPVRKRTQTLPVQKSEKDDDPFSSSGNMIPAPPESFDHSFGIDALQAAFSAKYYELANKCKSWEKYAAKLRAQAEVLEVENRVLREQNVQLETENTQLKEEQKQHEQERQRVESRLSSLEDRFPPRSISGGDLGGQFRSSGEILAELDKLSIPSAPSSAEKTLADLGIGQIPYCSSNLQVEDRLELRPPTPVSALSLPIQLPHPPSSFDLINGNHTITGRRSLSTVRAEGPFELSMNKRDSASLAEIINQDAAHRESGSLYGEGRSSRLGSRSIDAEGYLPAPRSGTLPASATFPPGPNGQYSGTVALTSQALAAMNRQHATTVRPPPASIGMMPIQGKRRSTISGDRSLDMNLTASVRATTNASSLMAFPAQGADLRTRGASTLSDAATVTGDYFQEHVEQRRQLRRTSFTVQQQQVAVGASLAGSRPASRLSNVSTATGDRTRRARSRAGSVHDAIPVVRDDLFCETTTIQNQSAATSPLLNGTKSQTGHSDNGHGSPPFVSETRRILGELHQGHPRLVSNASESSSSILSGNADSSTSSIDAQDMSEDRRASHRKLYSKLRSEFDAEEMTKFEKYVHRYDGLEIPLDGPKGLINRVKKLLLLTDPEIRSKHDKLRVRKELAREFERVVRQSV